MSHFVFGVVEGVRDSARQKIGEAMDVCWGARLQQPVVIEMLEQHGKPAATETPFCLTAAGGDNADGLVSPYHVDRNQIIERIGDMLAWLDRERTGRDAELWLTEGYDNAFRELQGTQQDIHRLIEQELMQTADVPSLRLILKSST
jgi:hypothetical protein